MQIKRHRAVLILLWSTCAWPVHAQGVATGIVGRTLSESTEFETHRPAARFGAPNILVWMIDDTGFGQLSCYGGLVDTPNIDRVAKLGLRYSNYHTTPICSASRAAFLTGRNSHTVHVGGHSALAIDFPGQDALVPRNAGTIAENLRQSGYLTYALGKWDHLPPRDASAAGPFTYWPSGQGFDRFYGFLSFDANNFAPLLWSDHSPVELSSNPNYHLTSDLADHAIQWIASREAAGPKRAPFFMYWATGAAHSPHHAPSSWLARYKGRFDQGWDVAREQILANQKALGIVPRDTVLPPRPDGMAAWNSLSPDAQRVYSRSMEAFAAQLSHADAEFGRILDQLEKEGELDNTIIVVVSDNGASGEGAVDGTFSEAYMANGRFATVPQNLAHLAQWGGPETYPLYPVGWAVAGDTPFRYYKQTAYEGGTRVPLIISWPKGIAARGEVRGQYHHVSDMLATLLDAAEVKPAASVNGEKQMPFDGVSMTYTFENAGAPTTKHVQYYEMYGNRALWADGWKAVMPHRLKTWDFKTQPPITDRGWQLYDIRLDPNERNDLAAREPEKLAELVSRFDTEARKFNVYPLTNTGGAQALMRAKLAAGLAERGGKFVYEGPVSRIPESLAPPLQTYSFAVNGDFGIPDKSSGALIAMGGRFGGIGLYLRNNLPVVAYRGADGALNMVEGRTRLAGQRRIGFDFSRTGAESADITLRVDDKVVATRTIHAELAVFQFSSNETFDIGQDTGTPVLADVKSPYVFHGRIGKLVFQMASHPNTPLRAAASKITLGVRSGQPVG